MALINSAILLAQKKKKVLIVDFDLEAPGVSSYNSFREIDCTAGLVDIVERYSETGRAENVNEYIKRTQIGNEEVWVLPAGNYNSPHYGSRFSSIDWNLLYEKKHGYLFFEDMRQQWANAGFDYVLIDSRTGHTDTAGICTRQLPDLVVTLFVPTDQNIRGLAPILEEMIEGGATQLRQVEHMVCASNVPDVDDEDEIIDQQLDLARRLFPHEIMSRQDDIPILNHYSSIDMLVQREFVVSRPKSRLAKQYRQLHNAITRFNLGDREGALARLRDVITRLDSSTGNALVARANNDDHLFQLISEIRSVHQDDGEIEFLCARIARYIGDFDTEIAALSGAISQGYRAIASRLNRASAFSLCGDKDAAVRDLLDVAHGLQSSPLEIRAAISRLRLVLSENWLATLVDGISSPDGKQDLLDVIAYEATRNRSLAVQYDDFLIKLSLSLPKSEAGFLSDLGSIALLKISALRPIEAISVMNSRSGAASIQDCFNSAIAHWMVSGEPRREDFSRVLEMSSKITEISANVAQCLMLCSSVAHQSPGKRSEVAGILKRFPISGFHFNCDTFILSPANKMTASLAAYKKSLLAGELITPSIVSEYRSMVNAGSVSQIA